MLTFMTQAGHYVLSSLFPSWYADPFIEAAKSGDIQKMTQMIDAGEDLSTKGSVALIEASKSGHLMVVDKLLAQAAVQADVNQNEPFRAASQNGHVSVMRRLLQEDSVNPAAKENDAIIRACEKGHYNAVVLLMNDKRVNPADMHNFAVRTAMAKGYANIVQRLLQDERVNPNVKQNEGLKKAARRNHDEVVFCLMEHCDKTEALVKQLYPHIYTRYQQNRESMKAFGEVWAQVNMPMDILMHLAPFVGGKYALKDMEKGYIVGCALDAYKEKKAQQEACLDLLPLAPLSSKEILTIKSDESAQGPSKSIL